MSRFQRMVIIPQDEYNQLMSVQKVIHPYTQPYRQLEQRYEENTHIQDPYSRLLHEADTQKEMRLMQDNIRSDLLTSIPKMYKNRAESLLKKVEPHVKVNQLGELNDLKSGKAIANTHLDDLIQYAVSVKRRAFVPKGWHQFVRELRTINVPMSILNKETIQELSNPETLTEKKVTKVKKSKLPMPISPKQKRVRRKSTRYPSDQFLTTY